MANRRRHGAPVAEERGAEGRAGTSVAKPERKFVEMLPLASGFRGEADHKLQLTTSYAVVLPHLELPRFHGRLVSGVDGV